MTVFLRSKPTSLRFIVWLVLALPLTLGVGALGYSIPASAFKIDLLIALQLAFDLLLGWLFGLLRFGNRSEVGMSILVAIVALAIRPILLVLAIISTLFCGIDAC